MTAEGDRAVRALVDRLAIQDTLTSFCDFLDRKQIGQVSDTFVEDAVFADARGHLHRGRGEIAAFLSEWVQGNLATSLHLSNTRVQLDGDRGAAAQSYLHAWLHRVKDGKDVLLWGRFYDILVCRNGVWLLQERRYAQQAKRVLPRVAMRDPAEDQLDRESVRAVLGAYCRHVDAFDVEAVLGLFTDDAVFDYGFERVYRGRDQLRDLFGRLSRYSTTSHHLDNITVVVGDDGTATADSYIYAFHRRTDGGEMHLWGRYLDVLHKDSDGRWRLHERRLRTAAEKGTTPDSGQATQYEQMPRLES